MPAGVVEDQQFVPLHHGDADPPPQQRLHQVLRKLAHCSVEKLDQFVPGVEAGQLFILHQPPIPQPVLLTEDDRLLVATQSPVHLGVGDIPLAQTAVRAIVADKRRLLFLFQFRVKFGISGHEQSGNL